MIYQHLCLSCFSTVERAINSHLSHFQLPSISICTRYNDEQREVSLNTKKIITKYSFSWYWNLIEFIVISELFLVFWELAFVSEFQDIMIIYVRLRLDWWEMGDGRCLRHSHSHSHNPAQLTKYHIILNLRNKCQLPKHKKQLSNYKNINKFQIRKTISS